MKVKLITQMKNVIKKNKIKINLKENIKMQEYQ
jgi:hypothetical protein